MAIVKGCDGLKKPTQLARIIDIADVRARYDTQVKKLLSNKAILSWILKCCTKEYAEFSPEEISAYIGETLISEKALHAIDADVEDDTGAVFSNENIEGRNTEDVSLREQTVYYDIKMNTRVPSNRSMLQLIINIEVQLDTMPGYPLEKRAIYYCSRLISSQYGTVFTHSDYGKLCKVYSIWICPDPPKKLQNTIKRIYLKEDALFGDIKPEVRNIDLIQAVIVNLGDPNIDINNDMLRLMNVLLSDKTEVKTKKEILHKEFGIPMSMEIESEVEEMCNLSEGIYNRGLQEGISQGISQGINRGLTIGIEGAVELLRDAGLDDTSIVRNIMSKYGISRDEAQKYVRPIERV